MLRRSVADPIPVFISHFPFFVGNMLRTARIPTAAVRPIEIIRIAGLRVPLG
jgi:hypothetical protein